MTALLIFFFFNNGGGGETTLIPDSQNIVTVRPRGTTITVGEP